MSSPKSRADGSATHRKMAAGTRAGSSRSGQPASLATARQAPNAPFERASAITAGGTEHRATFSTTTVVPSAAATDAIADTSDVHNAQLPL